MKKLTSTIHVFAVCLLVLAASSIATAQATRTWVSGVGMDSNPCSRTAPCQTFAGAIGKTAPGGEISVLDPHGYGAVTITKSITINAEGSLASVLVGLNSTGIVINAGASDVVYLKNIDINGAGNGNTGINWIAGNAVIMDRVKIANLTNVGFNINKSANGYLSMTNSSISNCINGGLIATTSSGTIRADIDNTKVFGCSYGFKILANTQFTIKDSSVSGCGVGGFQATGGLAVMNLQACVATHNASGVKTELGGVIRLGQSTVSNNLTKGLDTASGGTIESYQDNYIGGNPNSDAPSPVGKS